MLAKVDSKDTETVIRALIKHAHKLPKELYKSLTWDRGKELADQKQFTPGDRREGILLRSTESMASRVQREYQRITQAVLPQRHGPVSSLPGEIKRRGEAAQHQA